jgi:hypothetical protein
MPRSQRKGVVVIVSLVAAGLFGYPGVSALINLEYDGPALPILMARYVHLRGWGAVEFGLCQVGMGLLLIAVAVFLNRSIDSNE